MIAECLARPVLAERLITELYGHEQRIHGELKQRAEADLLAHRSVSQMKQTSGTYTEMEWIKSDSAKDGSASADEKSAQAVKMNDSEWQESLTKTRKRSSTAETLEGKRLACLTEASAAGAAALQKGALAHIKTGVLSPLQEDDAHYYAVAVMKKGKDRLKLATIAWLKEPLQSWLAKAEAQVPVTMAAVSANYTLPVIAESVGCLHRRYVDCLIRSARSPTLPHGSLDWHRNDRLGWMVTISAILEHRRQIQSQYGHLDAYEHHQRALCPIRSTPQCGPAVK